jgi:hypothetical protein
MTPLVPVLLLDALYCTTNFGLAHMWYAPAIGTRERINFTSTGRTTNTQQGVYYSSPSKAQVISTLVHYEL